jgi:hypothetical protein
LWAEWCRDPLFNLGCRDPVERIEALKANDPRRQRIGELFRTWWDHHGAEIMKANDLAEPVKAIADPQGRARISTSPRQVAAHQREPGEGLSSGRREQSVVEAVEEGPWY